MRHFVTLFSGVTSENHEQAQIFTQLLRESNLRFAPNSPFEYQIKNRPSGSFLNLVLEVGLEPTMGEPRQIYSLLS